MRISRLLSSSGRAPVSAALALALAAPLPGCGPKAGSPDKAGVVDTAKIAEEAFVYAYPMVEAYGIMNAFFVDKTSNQYKGPFNQIINYSRVFTPADTAVVTPNSDTPYSFLEVDLRAEPMVVCVPEVEKGRYYSIQLTDMYTFNYGYIGSRATGNGAGCYLIAGPRWKGETPAGIAKVFPTGTEFATAIFRTQLFNPGDMENVKKIQASYKALPLSQFLKQPAPPAAPAVDFPKIDKELAKKNFFSFLNFVLQFCPEVPEEKELRARFAQIGVAAGKPFDFEKLSAADKAAFDVGMKAGLDRITKEKDQLGKNENGWRVATSGFGDRAAYKGNWALRAAAAMAGIYGNDAIEALYPMTTKDEKGETLDGSKYKYTITFPAGQFPPVNAFWSVTMYDGKTQLLVKNPIDRYLINSPMLPGLKKNKDGSLTMYVQKDSPGKDKAANWLPAPNDTIYLVMRLYWPKEEALNGTWKPSPVVRVP